MNLRLRVDKPSVDTNDVSALKHRLYFQTRALHIQHDIVFQNGVSLARNTVHPVRQKPGQLILANNFGKC